MAEKTKASSGMHRAKLWEIGMYALNNTSTNLYLTLVGYISYYLRYRCVCRILCYHNACLGRCY